MWCLGDKTMTSHCS